MVGSHGGERGRYRVGDLEGNWNDVVTVESDTINYKISGEMVKSEERVRDGCLDQELELGELGDWRLHPSLELEGKRRGSE